MFRERPPQKLADTAHDIIFGRRFHMSETMLRRPHEYATTANGDNNIYETRPAKIPSHQRRADHTQNDKRASDPIDFLDRRLTRRIVLFESRMDFSGVKRTKALKLRVMFVEWVQALPQTRQRSL